MKKFFLLLSLTLLAAVGNSSYGFPDSSKITARSEAEARSIAGNFLSSNKKKIDNKSFALTYVSKGQLRDGEDKTYYYVFNRGMSEGYIIVSADNRTKNVLGYADEGNFDYANLPENFRSWLEFYKSEINSLDDETTTADTLTSSPFLFETYKRIASEEKAISASVQPLIMTKWDQVDPFNAQCPTIGGTHAPVGCVATAMAQVMKYHEWPTKGTGSNTYTPPKVGKALTVNFGSTTYNWANMLHIYSNDVGSTSEKNAVATLMYHCGVAVNMGYDKNSSGASDFSIPDALETYFGYDSGVNIYVRAFYSYSDWVSMIKEELSAKRPVIYSGNSREGTGHAFVCDGYNSDGFFHFNWGWTGSSDGYYELSALNPLSLGTGGGAGGYNYSQSIITGIQRPTNGSLPSANFIFKSIESNKSSINSSSDVFSLTTYYAINIGRKTFNGTIGFALCRTDNSIISYFSTNDKEVVPSFSGYSVYGFSGFTSSSFPAAGATYRLIPAYCHDSKPNQAILMKAIDGGIPYLEVKTSAGGKATITQAVPIVPKLTLNSFKATTNLYQNRTGEFSAEIKNTGTGDYSSAFAVVIQRDTIIEPAVIQAGVTKTIKFSTNISLSPGTYTIKLLYDADNNLETPKWTSLVSLSITVKATPSAPKLSLTSASFPNPQQVNSDNPNLSATIKNTGGLFDGEFIAFVFPANGNYSISNFGDQQALIETNETKTIVFDSPIGLSTGSYRTAIFYYGSSGWEQLSSVISFTMVVNTANERIDTNSLKVSLDRSNTTLYVYSDYTVETLSIYTIWGGLQLWINPNTSGIIEAPINNLSSGVYIVNIQTKDKKQTTKFIKR